MRFREIICNKTLWFKLRVPLESHLSCSPLSANKWHFTSRYVYVWTSVSMFTVLNLTKFALETARFYSFWPDARTFSDYGSRQKASKCDFSKATCLIN